MASCLLILKASSGHEQPRTNEGVASKEKTSSDKVVPYIVQSGSEQQTMSRHVMQCKLIIMQWAWLKLLYAACTEY